MPPLKENQAYDSSEEDVPVRSKKASKLRSSTRQHIITKHNYHDHLDDPVVVTSSGANNPSFPAKLHEMLDQVEADGNAHVISWQPHGRCFVVHDSTAFKGILNNYFKLSKLASFQRQLNLYGFQRLTAGLDKNGYYHELFLRGRTDLVARMNRIKVKGTGVRAKANPDEEPDLYVYPSVDSMVSSNITPLSSRPKQFPIPMSLVGSLSVPLQLPSVTISNESSPVTVPSNSEITPSRKSTDIALQSLVILDENDSSILDRLIDSISTVTGGEAGAIDFDRLIDVMFTHDQTVKFADLIKLAKA